LMQEWQIVQVGRAPTAVGIHGEAKQAV